MLVEVDKELEDVFPRYLTSRKEDLAKLNAAMATQDFETMRQMGHKIYGNALGYGLREFGELAKALELAAASLHGDKCQIHIQAMETYIGELKVKFVEM